MIRPRKRFGQNFLQDQQVIERIVDAIAPKDGDHIIEIGPGRGALTAYLIKSPARLSVIEIDRDLAKLLKDKYPDLDIKCEDVLKMELTRLGQGPFRIVGNLPYNISTPLLFNLFSHGDLFRDMHFMLQKEVVDRMGAVPSTASYGRLSIMTQLYCRVEKLFEVPPEAFNPRPKVRSAVVRLTLNENLPRVDARLLEELLTHAFSFRRKTLRNAMKKYLAESELHHLGIDPGARPENLTAEQYITCANFVQDSRNNS